MISEGSCNTEDRSNDVENSDLPSPGINYILKYIKIDKKKTKQKKKQLNCYNISEYYCFLLYCSSNKCSLG